MPGDGRDHHGIHRGQRLDARLVLHHAGERRVGGLAGALGGDAGGLLPLAGGLGDAAFDLRRQRGGRLDRRQHQDDQRDGEAPGGHLAAGRQDLAIFSARERASALMRAASAAFSAIARSSPWRAARSVQASACTESRATPSPRS